MEEQKALKRGTIRALLTSDNMSCKQAGAIACLGRGMPMATVEQWLGVGHWEYTLAAIYSMIHESIPEELIHDTVRKVFLGNSRIRKALEEVCEKRTLGMDFIEELIFSHNYLWRKVGYAACNGTEVPIEWLYKGLKDIDDGTRKSVPRLLEGREVPLEKIEEWRNSSSSAYREAAMCASVGRGEVPFSWIEALLDDPASHVWNAAVRACEGRLEPREYLNWWGKPAGEGKTLAAVQTVKLIGCSCTPGACEGCENADFWHKIELLATTCSFASVRRAAAKAYGIRNFVPVRDLEPPRHIYKECLDGAYVVAQIPETAHVRRTTPGRARASEAIIEGVIKNRYEEKVGVSPLDLREYYRPKDTLVVEDFDLAGSSETRAPGFYFALA